MAGTQRHRAHSRWDDESPKALEDSAPKRQKVNDAQRSATIPRQLTCTAANGLLMFIEVHKVNDRMTIGSFFYAFEEARPQLSILRLHEGVTVGTLKVLMRILIHGLQTTTPEDVLRKLRGSVSSSAGFFRNGSISIGLTSSVWPMLTQPTDAYITSRGDQP